MTRYFVIQKLHTTMNEMHIEEFNFESSVEVIKKLIHFRDVPKKVMSRLETKKTFNR